jgi:hypothetical protein
VLGSAGPGVEISQAMSGGDQTLGRVVFVHDRLDEHQAVMSAYFGEGFLKPLDRFNNDALRVGVATKYLGQLRICPFGDVVVFAGLPRMVRSTVYPLLLIRKMIGLRSWRTIVDSSWAAVI